MYENRVLTYDEVLALEDEQEVYVEESSTSQYNSTNAYGFGVKELIKNTQRNGASCSKDWSESNKETHGKFWRVWLLPQPPTPEELAANPWPDEPDAHD